MIPDFRKDGLDTATLAGKLGKTEKTIRQWRAKRRGPPWYELEGRIVYLRSDVETWLASRRKSERCPVTA